MKIAFEHALLRKKIESFYHLSDESFQKFSEIMVKKKYRKGEVLLREGEVCQGFWYIISGSVRNFSFEDGHEINLAFYFDDEITSNFYSVWAQAPSKDFYMAMEDCETLYFSQKEIIDLFGNDLEFIQFIFRFYQNKFFKQQSQSNSFKRLDPVERYKHLLRNQPHYLQRIP